MPDSTNDTHIEELLDNLGGGYWPEKHAALTALIAERDALQAKVKEHAEDRRKYIDAWAEWIDANAGLEIDQWLRVYADAVPIPSPDGDEAKQRIFKHLDQRMRDASDAIDALRKRVAELESQEFTLPHDPFRDADRDLRERLVESALQGSGCRLGIMKQSDAEELGRQAAWIVNGALAAMRKGDTNA